MVKIRGYEGYYLAGMDGEIYSIRNKIFLKPTISNKGYLQVQLQKDGKIKRFSVHRLIALTYLPNPENKHQVNHIDGNKLNNHLSNLEWSTNRENWDHAIDKGLLKVESKSTNHARLVKVICKETGLICSITEAAKINGISKSTLIYMLRKGKRNKTTFSLL